MPETSPQTNRLTTAVRLAPPRGPLPESFWWAHRLEIAGGLLLLVAGVIVAIVLGRRSKSVVRVPPAVQARRDLEILRACGSKTGLPVDTARVIRRFVVDQFELASDEMTTAELIDALRRVAPDRAGPVADFLRRCDVMKFAPDATPGETDLVTEAMQLVERLENESSHEATTH